MVLANERMITESKARTMPAFKTNLILTQAIGFVKPFFGGNHSAIGFVKVF
jgi:hypothetical protein